MGKNSSDEGDLTAFRLWRESDRKAKIIRPPLKKQTGGWKRADFDPYIDAHGVDISTKYEPIGWFTVFIVIFGLPIGVVLQIAISPYAGSVIFPWPMCILMLAIFGLTRDIYINNWFKTPKSNLPPIQRNE